MAPPARSIVTSRLLTCVVGVLVLIVSWGGATWGERETDPARQLEQLERLATGSVDEKTAAARWLGLHLAEEAYQLLEEQYRAAPRNAAHAEFLRTAPLMLLILRRPQTLEFRSLDEVLQHLDDPAVRLRASAVRHLAYYAPEGAVGLAAPFLDDPEGFVRDEAVTTLRNLGDRNHAERVIELLEDTSDTGAAVRLRALEYLLDLDRPQLLPRLVEVAADASPWIAQPAVRALQQDGRGPAVVAAILAKLRTERSAEVLARYLAALERIEDRDGWPRGWNDDIRPLLTHADGAVRQGAAVLLGDGDPDVARDVLVGLLASDDAVERLAAANALAGGEWTVEAGKVERLLDDHVAAVRVAAIDLTTTLPPARRRTLLLRLLERQDEDSDVLSRALAGLAEVGTTEDVSFLVERARRTEADHVRINAALTMAVLERRFDTTVARDWFREQLLDPAVGRPQRQAIVSALQVVGDPSFLPLLADELRATPATDRSYAAALIQTMSVLVGRQVHGADFAAAGS